MRIGRRGFLAGLGAAGALSVAGVGFAQVPTENRFILVILRGGLDGLAAVPAWGDPDYAKSRGGAALPAPGAPGGIVDLDGRFGLHPELAPLKAWFTAGDLAFVHAVAPPYRGRSHFDGQDVLENGTGAPRGRPDGWLNRAIGTLGAGAPPTLALGADLPLVLRGDARVPSLDPLRRAAVDGDFMDRVAALYADDPVLGPALAEAVDARAGLEMAAPKGKRRDGTALVEAAAGLVGAADGPRVAVLQVGGWDTHQGEANNLDRRFRDLAAALQTLRDGLGPAWASTCIVACTEFGRMVRGNGTGGTDHGTGGVALLAGGAVAGGHVYGDWPGLSERALLDGRDLRPTTDLRSVFKGVLRDHLRVAEGALEDRVFPDSRAATPLAVVRADS